VTRKTPVRHKVRDHTRSGVHVRHYERGSGKTMKLTKTSGVRSPRFMVVISDSNKRGTLSIIAPSIPEAVDRGLDKTTVDSPVRIIVRRV